jgi:transcriptional regulator with XRE-family HTH domain
MGYRGKLAERERARELRAQSWTLNAIAAELGVSKASVSVWVRDVDFVPTPRSRGHPAGPHHPMRLRKEAEIASCRDEADAWIGSLTERELTMFALGLYAGEGDKTGGSVGMANTNPVYLLVFLTWLRRTFQIDESRLRVVLYLHEGLDIDAALAYWSTLLGIAPQQFTKPYRAEDNPTIRLTKHVFGCPKVRYSSTFLQRRVLAMIEAVSCRIADPG